MKRLLIACFCLTIFLSSLTFAENYPKIDISGYKKWGFKGLEVNPKSNTFLAMSQIGYYPNLSGADWQEELNLKINAELSDKLLVTYDVEQTPDLPERFDIKVNYDKKHELLFGDFTANFSGNEFASSTKSLNGIQVSSKGDNYELLAVPSGKSRSQVQSLTSQKGNNLRGPYSLGHGTIIEGSETIWLNGTALKNRIDYTIDYFEGKVTFNQILTTLDEFKYSFEYANLADFFIPTLSKRDFTGIAGKYSFNPSTKKEEPPEYNKLSSSEAYPNSAFSFISKGEEEEFEYRLENYPIAEFSEEISFEGKTLAKSIDYSIDYNEGIVKLFTAQSPSPENPILINYKYYLVTQEAESIYGSGSQGYYFLSRAGLAAGSEKIKVNGKLLLKDVDYTINYEKGAILFSSNVSSTSQIDVKYERKIEIVKEKDKSKPIATIGVTYLKESSKRGEGVPNLPVSGEKFTAASVISNQNTIQLSQLPLVSSSEGGTLIVQKNGVNLFLGVDYVVPSVEADFKGNAVITPPVTLHYLNDSQDLSDGYATSTIKILTALSATDEITVSYDYKKVIPGQYPSKQGDGTRGPYYLSGYRNIVPGTAVVQVASGGSLLEKYTPNSTTSEADAGDKGYKINFSNSSITFNNPLLPEKSFTVTFNYVPSVSEQGRDYSQSVTDVNLNLQLGRFNLNGEFAASEKNNVITSSPTTELFTGLVFNPPALKILLGHKNIIEKSDQVYVNRDKRNRENNYDINYTLGVLTFFNMPSLTATDEVVVVYDYETGGKEEPTGSALKLGAGANIGLFDFTYNNKTIGKTFNPMGGTSIGKGSKYQDFTTKFDPKFQDLVVTYDYKENNDLLGSSEVLSTYDHNYNLFFNPNKLASINFNTRHYEKKATDNSHNSFHDDYGSDITPPALKRGELVFSQNYQVKKTNLQDLAQSSTDKTDRLYFRETLDITKRFNLSYEYEINEPETTTKEGISNKTIARNYTYRTNFDLTGIILPKLEKWTGYANVKRDITDTSFPTPVYREIQNITYHMDINPFNVVTILFDNNRTETPSIVVAGKNPKNDTTSLNFNINPHSRLNGSLFYSESANISDTGLESSGRSNTYSFNFTPIKTNSVELSNKYSLRYSKGINPSGSLEVATEDQQLTQDYSISFIPLPILTIIPGFGFTDYWRVKSDSPYLKTNSQTAKCQTTLNIREYTLTGNYENKVTNNLAVNVMKNRSLIDIKLSRKVFNWGDLSFSHIYEDNKGEVLSTGDFPELDYQKKTQQMSLNFKIPQDNPVLSSMDLIISGKQVDYTNKLKPTDNLTATLLTFEGTLNF